MNELDFAGMEKMLEQKTAEKKDFEQFSFALFGLCVYSGFCG